MRRTILSLSVLFVLAFVAGTVLAQGKGEGKKRGGGPGDRTANVDVNAPGAGQKKAVTPEDIDKQTREKMKDLKEQGQGQGKTARDQVQERMDQTRGKANEQQMRAFEKQMQHDAAKHMERQARLARIRELAVQKGDQKMVARVDELIAKENQLHERKLLKMQGQKRAGGTLPPTEVPQTGMAGKGKDKIDVNKPAAGAGQTMPPAPVKPPEPQKPAETQKPPEPKPQ